jgi:hypothetical protein
LITADRTAQRQSAPAPVGLLQPTRLPLPIPEPLGIVVAPRLACLRAYC